MNILDVIKEEIKNWNLIEKQFPEIDKRNYKLFELEDFDYLTKYAERYQYQFEPLRFFNFSALSRIEELTSCDQRNPIWYWEGETNDFIIPQLKYLFSLIKSYIELKDRGQEQTALIVFRSYIEISSQLYACLLDYDFYNKYVSESLDEEYIRYWFKHLKPDKVLSTLRRVSQYAKLESKSTGEYIAGDLRKFIYPFESELRQELYAKLSAYSHGKYKTINFEANQNDLNQINWNISEFLMVSVKLIEMLLNNYLIENNEFNSRKSLILFAVWNAIKAKN